MINKNLRIIKESVTTPQATKLISSIKELADKRSSLRFYNIEEKKKLSNDISKLKKQLQIKINTHGKTLNFFITLDFSYGWPKIIQYVAKRFLHLKYCNFIKTLQPSNLKMGS